MRNELKTSPQITPSRSLQEAPELEAINEGSGMEARVKRHGSPLSSASNDRSCRNATETTANSDVLRIDGKAELSAILAAAVVCQRAE